VLLLFTIQTGLRLSELIALRQCDIHLERGAHVRCEGKGRKQRSTPLTRTTVQTLKAWVREEGTDEAKILFPSAQGGRLSHDSVQYLVSKYAKSAAQCCATLRKKRVTPHVLRHTTAMELLQAGVDRSVIALWLGHESVETTQIYLDANLALKEEALKKTSPVNTSIGRFKPDDQLLSFLRNL
jgi:site-specific recombinase XerD